MRVASFGSCLSRRIIDELELLNSEIEVISCTMQLKVSDFINTNNTFNKIDLYELAKKSSNSPEVQLNVLQQHKDISGIFRTSKNPDLYPFKTVFEGEKKVDLLLIDNFPELVFRSSVDEDKRRVFIPNVAQGTDIKLDLLDYDPLDKMVNVYNEFLSKLRRSQPNAKIFILNFPVVLSKSTNIRNRGGMFYDTVISKLPLKELNIINLKINKPMAHQMKPNYSHFNNHYYRMFAYRILGYFNDQKIDSRVRSLSTFNNDVFLNKIFSDVKSYPVRIDSYVESYIWKSRKKDEKYHVDMVDNHHEYLLLDFELILEKLNNYQSVSHEGIVEDLVTDKDCRLQESSFLNLNKCVHYLTITKEIKILFNDWQRVHSKLSDKKRINRIILLEKKAFNKDGVFIFSAEFEDKDDFISSFKEYISGLQYTLK
ncbi:hypothetical protein [Psychromonas ossibalaenae]|uniref:hypothetical protein n=1 Tax=Psychromonas ossibalaenae TaxID=444922 RepID=UPI00035E7A6F|nr:hypothetical protein [Psychromonas ossibalaenae]